MPPKHEIYENSVKSELVEVGKEYNGIITKYDNIYCKYIIEHCSEGLAIEDFAGRYHIDPDSMQLWLKEYKEFKAACKCAVSVEYLFYNKMLLETLKDPDLDYRLPSINRKLSQLETLLLKNSIRRSLFANYEDVQDLTKDEKDALTGLNDFIGI